MSRTTLIIVVIALLVVLGIIPFVLFGIGSDSGGGGYG